MLSLRKRSRRVADRPPLLVAHETDEPNKRPSSLISSYSKGINDTAKSRIDVGHSRMQRFRFLLSGLGLIGSAHFARIMERDDSVVTGIVDPDLAKHQQLTQRTGATLYASIEEALAAGQYDGAIISSPNRFHYDQTMRCIEAGLTTLVEKPLTDDVETAKAIVDAARESGVRVLVGHHRAHSPLLQAARAFISSPEFGRLVTVQGSALFYKPADYFAAGPWRSQLGGGPALINLIHEIGILRYLCGEITDVTAFTSNAIRSFPVEDTLAVSLRFENGCLGNFILSDSAASSKSWEMTSGENKAYPFFADEYAYHVAGTNGSLDLPSMKARLYSAKQPASWWRPFEHRELATLRCDPLRRQIDHLIHVIRGNAEPVVTASDGYRNMVVLDAILQSAHSGQSRKVMHG